MVNGDIGPGVIGARVAVEQIQHDNMWRSITAIIHMASTGLSNHERVSDLILDSKLETSFLPNCTVHTFQESDLKSRQRLVTRSEHWRRQKKIGGGGFGTVWLETYTQDTSSSTSAPLLQCVQSSRLIWTRDLARLTTIGS
jgi:hypothetical protein